MKVIKVLLAIFTLGAVTVGLFGCSEPSEEMTPETQIAPVTRGDLSLDITAAGNLALSHTEDLTIDLFYGQSGTTGTKGTIGEVLVEEGDTVTEGQVMVTVDRDEWDDQLSALEDLVTTKDRALVTAQINLKTAEQNLKNARDTIATKELAVLNAQISLDQAVNTLAAGIAAVDYDAALAELRIAEAWYKYVTTGLAQSGGIKLDDIQFTLEQAEERLVIARTEYDNILSGYDSRDVAIKKKQVESAELSLASAGEDLADAKNDVSLKELSLTLSQGNLEDAEKALEDANEDLEEARSKSPEIKAPFDGFITVVYVESGDEVVNGTLAIQIADPDKFEANILVSEMDILQLEIGLDAWVEVDAIEDMSFPAEVTHISPTATISSGVVNYELRVEIESMEAVVRESQQAMATDIAAGEIPPFLQTAIDEGTMTQEEVEEMLAGGEPPEGMTPPEGMELPEGFEMPGGMESSGESKSGSQAQSQLSSLTLEDFQLREGLTVTVTIIVAESTDVLLVPNAAITSEGGQSYVQVVTASGGTEQRAIETGSTDYQFTEVTDGLTEGEEIIVPEGTVTTPTSSEDDERPRMGLFGPGK